MEIKFTDVIILGSGPAGLTAAIYAKRSGLDVILFNGNNPGGQLMTTTDVENYPGFDVITGPDLMMRMINQCKKLNIAMIDQDAFLVLKKNDFVCKYKLTNQLINQINNNNFVVLDEQIDANIKRIYVSKVVILATGAKAKWLGLENEIKLRQSGGGVSGCATCDGFFYKGKDVAVIGGGNTAAEEALFLSNIANKVYLIHRRDVMKCEKIMMDRILNNNKIEIIWNSTVEDMVISNLNSKLESLVIKNVQTNQISHLKVSGAFVAIGHTPNSDMVKDILEIDLEKYVLTKPGSTKTSCPGIFAAGDIQDKIFRQAATSVGTGCMAALEALEFINSNQ